MMDRSLLPIIQPTPGVVDNSYVRPGALNGFCQPLNVVPVSARDEVAVQVDDYTPTVL